MTLPALVSQVQRGGIVTEYADAVDEDAVMVRPMSWGARAWQTEAEPGIEPSAEPVSADADAAILSWLREHGVGTARYMAMDLWRFGGRAVCKARLEAMCRAGRVVRTPAGWYRIS